MDTNHNPWGTPSSPFPNCPPRCPVARRASFPSRGDVLPSHRRLPVPKINEFPDRYRLELHCGLFDDILPQMCRSDFSVPHGRLERGHGHYWSCGKFFCHPFLPVASLQKQKVHQNLNPKDEFDQETWKSQRSLYYFQTGGGTSFHHPFPMWSRHQFDKNSK